MTVAELIRALENTGVRRNETDVLIDGCDLEGFSVRMTPLGVIVRGGHIEILANEETS